MVGGANRLNVPRQFQGVISKMMDKERTVSMFLEVSPL